MDHLTKKNFILEVFYLQFIVSYYPSCATEICLKLVEQLLDFCKQNFLEEQCMLDAHNTCNFMCRHFTQIDGRTIGVPESASITYVNGAIFIYSRIENIINEDEDWKQHRDDSFSTSLRTCTDREIEKTEWKNLIF